jgi:hypothetical protein
MTKKRGLFADLECAMNGLASAHLGDYLPDRDKKAALGVAEPIRISVSLTPEAQSAHEARRRVALAVQGRVELKALHYARNACERMDADLDVLTDLPEGGLRADIEPQRADLAQAGHRLEVVRLGRDILAGILDYARARRGLLFVVVSAEDAVAERLLARSSDSRHLDVPWVVVTGGEPG